MKHILVLFLILAVGINANAQKVMTATFSNEYVPGDRVVLPADLSDENKIQFEINQVRVSRMNMISDQTEKSVALLTKITDSVLQKLLNESVYNNRRQINLSEGVKKNNN